jgi:hypothetical protein
MIKLFESLLGLAFLVAAIQFIVNPSKAIESINDVIYSLNPKIINGHLAIKGKK